MDIDRIKKVMHNCMFDDEDYYINTIKYGFEIVLTHKYVEKTNRKTNLQIIICENKGIIKNKYYTRVYNLGVSKNFTFVSFDDFISFLALYLFEFNN